MTFNPSAPNTIGAEWPVSSEGATTLDAPTKAHSLLIASTAAETISTLYVPHTWAGTSSGYGKLWADIYPLADAIATDETVVAYAPNEQIANDGRWAREDWSTTTNLHLSIDDADDSVDPWADYIANTNWGGEALARFCFASAGFTSTKRVLSVSFEVRALVPTWANGGAKLTLEHWYGSTKKATLGSITPTADEQWRTYTLGPFYLDANDDGPWSAATIIDFDGGSTKDNIALRALYTVKVTRVTMKVTYCTDKRVASGGSAKQTVLPSGRQTNLPINLAANWSKASATSYLAVVRRLDDPNVGAPATTLTPSPIWLDSAAANPHGQGKLYPDVVLSAAGAPTSLGAVSTRTAGFWLGTNGGAQSVDSQPYHDLDVKPCHTSSTLKQGVNAASAQSYRRVRALVAIAGAPTASLVFKVKKSSDNSQLGGDGTLTVANLSDSSIATLVGTRTFGSTTVAVYSVVVTLATSATLAAATDYYLEATSSTGTGVPWYLLWLDATAAHTLTGNITYGGSTDQSTIAGTGVAAADFPATLSSVPTTPTGLGVALQTLALPNANSMQFARVSWTATALGASFTRYELDRSTDGGTTWATIAKLLTESDVDFDDYEGPIGVATRYRLRVIRSDGAVSDYTASTSPVSPTASSGLCIFTSNAAPSMTTGFWLLGDSIEPEFLKASKTVFADLHGRDYVVGFKPLKKNGFRWPFTVVVHADRTTAPAAGAGMRGWSPILNVAEANVPYVCMKTFDGELFFGTLTASKGRRLEPAHLYLADCVFTQGQANSGAIEV
jgi:hypothetical protein